MLWCILTTACSPLEFTCADGTCVPAERKCDGYRDCPDDSDEYNCKYNSDISIIYSMESDFKKCYIRNVDGCKKTKIAAKH